MTTIILVIVGVVLAALSALFLIFYGGDVYKSGQVGAQASTLVNAGMNVRASSDGYFSQNGLLPASLTDLRGVGDAEWLEQADIQVQNAATGTGEIVDVGGSRVYRVTGVVTEDVCRRVNLDYSKVADLPTSMGSRLRGCYSDAGNLTFFVYLGNGGGLVAAQVPNPPSDPSNDQQAAAYISALGRYIASRQALSPNIATSLPDVSLTADQVRLDGIGRLDNGTGFRSYAGRNFFIVRGLKRSVCALLNQEAGANWDVGEGWALNYHGGDATGCGWQYNFDQEDVYFVNLDIPAEQARAAAAAALRKRVEDLYLANGATVRGAIQAAHYVPGNLSEINLALDYQGFGNDSGIESPYNSFPVYHRAYISNAHEDVCRSINVRGGGGDNVGRFSDGGDRGNRLFGCGGAYGDMYVWTRVDDVVTAYQAGVLQQQAAEIANAAGAGYSGDTSASETVLQAAIRNQSVAVWASRTGVGRIYGGGYVQYRVLGSAYTCFYINGGRSVPYADFDNQPSGCARGYDGNWYLWSRL